MRKKGYIIYILTGQSIKSLRDSGGKFWSTWYDDLPGFEALTSMHSEVAVNPKKLFLPRSNKKTLIQQEKMVNKFSEGLGKKIKGIKAIIGQAPDYAELAFEHLDLTGEYLVRARYSADYARTKTPTGTFDQVAHVGSLAGFGLDIGSLSATGSLDNVHAAPLIVPA